jgi:hypothetical protein
VPESADATLQSHNHHVCQHISMPVVLYTSKQNSDVCRQDCGGTLGKDFVVSFIYSFFGFVNITALCSAQSNSQVCQSNNIAVHVVTESSVQHALKMLCTDMFTHTAPMMHNGITLLYGEETH